MHSIIVMFQIKVMLQILHQNFLKKKKIDVLIYNVYSKPKNYYKPYEDYEYETWNNSVNSNLNGAFLISQILIKHFKSKKIKGNIIFLSST